MRNVYIVLFGLLWINSFAQGVDVIILIERRNLDLINDSGGEIARYNNMISGANLLRTSILQSNPDNRVAWVFYKTLSTSSGSGYNSEIFISKCESGNNTGFSSDIQNGRTTSPEWGNPGGANLYSAMQELDYALNSGPESSPYFQESLVHDPAKPLVVYAFKSKKRANGEGSSIVNFESTTLHANEAFANYTNFKNKYHAKIMVTTTSNTTDANAIAALASVASVGGGYNGSIEGYSNDPEGYSTLPRHLITVNDYLMTGDQVNSIVNAINNTELYCAGDISLTPPYNNPYFDNAPYYTGDYQQASNTITSNVTINYSSSATYHAGNRITLSNGFYSANTSSFHAYIEGCSGEFEKISSSQTSKKTVINKSNETQKEQDSFSSTNTFTLYPNPANSRVSLSAADGIKTVLVTSLDGKVMYNRNYSDTPTGTDLDISSYAQGYYMVSITTNKGEIHTQKLIKN